MIGLSEKFEVFYSAKEGDKESIKRVIAMYTPMVYKWVKNLSKMCQPCFHEDMVQEGVLGIVKALETYDVSRRSKDGSPINPSTWVWWKIRASVQSAARKYRQPQDSYSLGELNEEMVADNSLHTVSDPEISTVLEGVINDVCGSSTSRKAQIVRDRFGLNGNKPLTHSELSRKHGVSRQATNAHIRSFFREVRVKYPNLKEEIL